MSEFVVDEEKGIKIVKIPIDKVIPNEWNPNEMPISVLNQLAADVEEVGYLQPILVVPTSGGKYLIIDGEHRYDVAKLCDMDEIAAVVVDDGELLNDEDSQKIQTVRMNKLRGKLNMKKFRSLVEDLVERHEVGDLADKLLIEDEAQLEAILRRARESLPNDSMKKEFDKAKDTVKTMDDLTLLLNRLFTRHGHTLDYGYMIIDYGGKDSLWVRIKDKEEFERFVEVADFCRDAGKTFPSLLLETLRDVDEDWVESHKGALVDAEEDDSYF